MINSAVIRLRGGSNPHKMIINDHEVIWACKKDVEEFKERKVADLRICESFQVLKKTPSFFKKLFSGMVGIEDDIGSFSSIGYSGLQLVFMQHGRERHINLHAIHTKDLHEIIEYIEIKWNIKNLSSEKFDNDSNYEEHWLTD